MTRSPRTVQLFRSEIRHRPFAKLMTLHRTSECDTRARSRWSETSTSLVVCKSLTWSTRCLVLWPSTSTSIKSLFSGNGTSRLSVRAWSGHTRLLECFPGAKVLLMGYSRNKVEARADCGVVLHLRLLKSNLENVTKTGLASLNLHCKMVCGE